MAGQISHIFYAYHVYHSMLSQKSIDQRRFMVGTVFPDIRYLANMDREQTHFSSPSKANLLKLNNSFDLGMYTHVIVDVERIKILKRLGLYKLYPKEDLISHQTAKLIEDQLLYPQFQDWPLIIQYLEDITEEEMVMVGDEVAEKWHELLIHYFSTQPTVDSVAALAKGMGLNGDVVGQVTSSLKTMQQDDQTMEIISQASEELLQSL